MEELRYCNFCEQETIQRLEDDEYWECKACWNIV